MNSLSIKQFQSPNEAPKFTRPEFAAAKIDCVNIVRKGTEEGRSTVDLVFQDEKGQKYIVMLTGRLIHSLSKIIGDEG